VIERERYPVQSVALAVKGVEHVAVECDYVPSCLEPTRGCFDLRFNYLEDHALAPVNI
jgi:hypothetical protein